MLAGIFTLLGIVLSFSIGVSALGRTPVEVILAIGSSIVAGLISIPAVLRIQKIPSLQFLTRGNARSWATLFAVYFTLLLLFCPWLRDLELAFQMLIPLILSATISAILWGPMQDRSLRSEHERRKP